MTGRTPEPSLDAVWQIEVVALMVEGIVDRPCRYVTHAPWVWFTEDGRPVCGICHPRVGSRPELSGS